MSDPLELTRRLYLGQMTTGMTGLALSRLLMSDLGAAVPPGAHFNPTAARVDKDARLLWRFPPRRLGAEEIRDTLLATAGQLKLEPMGGPGFRLYRYLVNNVSKYIPFVE